MNIVSKLKELGVEVTPEVEKAFGGEWITEHEHTKKMSKIETERDNLKEQLTNAETTLKGFEGKDLDAMQKEIDEWKAKAEKARTDFEAKQLQQEKEKLIDEHIGTLTFTSEFAKRAYKTDLMKEELKVSNGKIYGLKEFYEDYDKSAFKDAKQIEAEQNRSQIVGQKFTNGSHGMTREELNKIIDKGNLRDIQRALSENPHLMPNKN